MLGVVEAYRNDDGSVRIERADPVIALSLALLIEDQAARQWLRIVDGQLAIVGVDPAGADVEYRYRAVGFQATSAPVAAVAGRPDAERSARLDMAAYDALRANEGGYLLLERIA